MRVDGGYNPFVKKSLGYYVKGLHFRIENDHSTFLRQIKYHMKVQLLFAGLFISIFSLSCTGGADERNEAATNGEVNVYTHRHYDTDQKLFKAFEDSTGIKVRVVSAGADELIQRMKLEGLDSPADVLITVDAGRLHRAKEEGLLQRVESDILQQFIPNSFKDTDNYWFGLTYRARILAYSPDRVSPDEILDYESLAGEHLKGRVLVRSSSNVYNQSLAASMLAYLGEEEFERWTNLLVENFARNPKGSDRDQIKAIASGEGDVALVNSYYVGKMLNSPNEREVEAARAVKVMFPNQENRGTHVNVSGAGVAKGAPNRENAVKFIEFLVSEEAQKEFAAANYEYPVREGVEFADLIQSWGSFKRDSINLSQLGSFNNKAVIIMDKAGWK